MLTDTLQNTNNSHKQNMFSLTNTNMNSNKNNEYMRSCYVSHNNSTIQEMYESDANLRAGQSTIRYENQDNNRMLNWKDNQSMDQKSTKNKIKKKRINQKLEGCSRSRSKSRSSSCSYSYCEANFMKKSIIKPKLKQSGGKESKDIKNNYKITQNTSLSKQQKLYNAIEQFYTNLSNMSLDILLSHEHPADWLAQQTQTCHQLQQKLDKKYKKLPLQTGTDQKTKRNKQNIHHLNTIEKQKENIHQYYQTKLQTVFGILDNIKNNIHMLNSLNQQEIRDCYSSTNSLASSLSGSLANSTIKDLHKHIQKYNSVANNNTKNYMDNLFLSSPALSTDRSPESTNSPSHINFKTHQDASTVPTSLRMSMQTKTKISEMDTKQTRNNSKSNQNYPPNHKSNYQTNNVPHPNKISQYKIEESLYEIRDQASKISKNAYKNNSNTSSAEQSITQNDSYTKMLQKFNTNINKLTTNKNPTVEQKIAKDYTKYHENKYNQNFLITTCKSEQSPSPSPQIQYKYTISKQVSKSIEKNKNEGPYHTNSQEQLSQYLQNRNNKTQRINPCNNKEKIQSLSQMIAKSLVNMNSASGSSPPNSNEQYVQTLLKNMGIIDGQAHMKNRHGQTVRNNYQQRKQSSSSQQSRLPTTLRPLLQQITELKTQLHDKNRQIEKLLTHQQELQSVIELYKNKQKDNFQGHKFAMERIKNMESVIDRYQKQLRRMKQADQQLRETAKNQSTYINNLHKQKQKLQQNMNQQSTNYSKMSQQIQKISQKHQEEIKVLKKKQKVSLEKMEIYKQKYYQLLHEVQLKKIVIDSSYSGKAGKVKEIWSILADHRKNLLGVDQDEEQKYLQKSSKAKSHYNSKNEQIKSQSKINLPYNNSNHTPIQSLPQKSYKSQFQSDEESNYQSNQQISL